MTEYDQETGEIVEPQVPMLALRREMNLIFSSPECGEVFGALCDMQGTMDAPKRTKKAKVRGETQRGGSYEYEYSYAPLEEIISTIKEPMMKSGLAYRQFLAQRGDQWVMRTIIGHRSGQWTGSDYPIFWEPRRGMQGFASGVTYARRYGLLLALGIAAEDDDDANVADGKVAQTEERRSVPRPAPVPAGNGAAKPTLASVTETPEKTRARELYNALVKDIGDASTEEELDTVASNGRCDEVDAAIQADGGHERAQTMMRSIDQRIATRRSTIQRTQQGREDMGL